jgi:hypothetical protein
VIRRSLRIGIRLGLLTGLVFVLFKIVQSRRMRPALPEGDGWATPPDGQSRASDPVLVRPTMPERPIRPRDRAPGDEAVVEAASVAPGPTEPFAMVEPDTAPPVTAAAAAEVPLDAVADVEADVDDALSRAPQAQAAPPPPATSPAAKKRAAKRAPAKRAPKKASKKAAKKATAARKAAGRKAAAARAPASKKAARKAPRAKAAGGRATAAPSSEATVGWVKPIGGTCPSTHPVKAKMATRIFHLPGMALYHRMSADRCYADAEAAENDGLRVSKR